MAINPLNQPNDQDRITPGIPEPAKKPIRVVSAAPKEIMDPETIWRRVGLTESMRVTDIGAGAGFFAIPAARIVKEKGKVNAVDILKEPLEDIKSKAKLEGLYNIKTIWGDAEMAGGTKVKPDSQDRVLLSNITHQVPDVDTLYKEAARIVKPGKDGGELVVIDWRKQVDTPIGPEMDRRVSEADVLTAAAAAGLKKDRDFLVDSYHYGIIFKK